MALAERYRRSIVTVVVVAAIAAGLAACEGSCEGSSEEPPPAGRFDPDVEPAEPPERFDPFEQE